MQQTNSKKPRSHCATQSVWGHWIRLAGLMGLIGLAAAPSIRAQVSPGNVQTAQETTADETSSDVGLTVVDVRIEGNDTIPAEVILQKIQTQPNRAVTERQLREDKRALMQTRWFFSVSERVEETDKGPVLVFKVHERPIVQSVTFIGNKKVKTKYLTAWTGLKVGSPFDHIANREAVHRIESEYKEKGFFFVKATLEKGGNPGERDIVFRIEEGPKVRVQHRTFEGNIFWNDGGLRKNLISKEAMLGFFGGFYRPETLPQDVDALKQFYRAVGFFDVEVQVDPRFSPDRSAVDLHYTIREGTRYTVREIRYQGNSVIATSQLKSDSKLLPGQMFNSHPLSKDVRRMLKYYGDLGHYFASVNPVPQFTEQPGIVDLVFEINEDRPRFIREINVAYEGDYPHTKQTVVWDRIQVAPGDLADPDKIRRSKSRLSGSGLFEPGIVFEPIPVEPDEASFASSSRTFRGQSASSYTGGYETANPTWTDRFADYTRRSAHLTVIGTLPWQPEELQSLPEDRFPDPDFTDEESDDTDLPRETPSAESCPSSVSAYTGPMFATRPVLSTPLADTVEVDPKETVPAESEIDTRTPIGGHTGLDNWQDRIRNPLAVSSPSAASSPSIATATTATAGNSNSRPQFLSELALTAAANPADVLTDATPQFVSFRSVSALQVFSIGPANFIGADSPSDDETIIRAQSPSQNFDPSTPRRTDPVLEGSPYRNQFQTVPPGWVDINVRAAEGRTGRLMFGAGVNSDAGLVGSFVWDESNFDLFRPPQTFADVIEGRAWRGGGQRFRLEAAPGDVVSRYALSWTDPYFMYTDYSLTVSGFYFNRFYPDWQEDRFGGRIGVGRQWTPEWSTNAALRLEDVQLSRSSSLATPDSLKRSLGSNFLSTVRLSATHDTRDMSIMPGEGHYTDFAYEQAFGEFTYPRVEGEFRQYFTLYNRPDGSGRQVLTLAGNLGWSGDDTPVFERYFAGGFQSFRGFAFRGVTPREMNVATGGIWQMLGTVEYRVPVTADDMINVVAFSDFGTVEDQVSVAHFRATAGFGLRVVVPAMGPVPLAFDFAFPLATEPFDNERIFSFYVGINR